MDLLKHFTEACFNVNPVYRKHLFLRCNNKVYDCTGQEIIHSRHKADCDPEKPPECDYQLPDGVNRSQLDPLDIKIYDDFAKLAMQCYRQHILTSSIEYEKSTFFIWYELQCPKTVMRSIKKYLRSVYSNIRYEDTSSHHLYCIWRDTDESQESSDFDD